MARTAFTIRESNDRDCRESGAAGGIALSGAPMSMWLNSRDSRLWRSPRTVGLSNGES
jgi:hypothetical protein